MASYIINQTYDRSIQDTHCIIVKDNGYSYNVIFGRYIAGRFCVIPDWNVGCELAQFNDVPHNTAALSERLSWRAAEAIALAIAEYAKMLHETSMPDLERSI